jgi:hypothetical protein
MSTHRGLRGPRSGDHPALLIAGAVIVVAVLCWILYLAGWWIFSDSTRRGGEVRRETFEFQQSTIDHAQNNITEIKGIDLQINDALDQHRSDLIDQRRAMIAQTCQLIAQVYGPLPTDVQAFHDETCR